MKELYFSTGAVTYTVNGKCELTFNPTDASFIERVYNLFTSLDDLQTKLETMRDDAEPSELFDIFRDIDRQMREKIDDALDAPVSEAVFGRMNVFALADGVPAWANFMFVILDEIPSELKAQETKTVTTINKYTKKYTKAKK